MKTKQLTLAMSLMLSACSSMNHDANVNDYSTDNSPTLQDNTLESSLQFKNQYTAQLQRGSNPIPTTTENQTTDAQQTGTPALSNINDYVRGLMQDLVSNIQYVNATTPVAVVSFVMLDSDYTQGNLLGNQIAESLIHEIHVFGIPVIDFKTTDYIMITESGDFAFTRNYEEITSNFPIRYIAGGTMLRYQDGYLINARIVGINSKAVVASAQTYIPADVIDAVLMNQDYTAQSTNDASQISSENNNSMSHQNRTSGKHLVTLLKE